MTKVVQAVVLEVWQTVAGDWDGRLLEDGVETGRVSGYVTKDDVQHAAAEIGIAPDEIRMLNQPPRAHGLLSDGVGTTHSGD